eukprot:CAMPEP_0168402772 /NCGR_PEP_ID=MMETSP0228-20121227/23789_1 /TAXON_ID=133427 /ORGANISM="Protoceratium reticulatum, Strain CCCM 535 (=CCMP 1889)" /LENGTH=54 /DNA_ID=CAMNT_0008416361 /DNA_START=17 /DNA_END=178 /DNA_ORIENTATION=+
MESIAGTGNVRFPDMQRIAERVGERFGPAEDEDCIQKRQDLRAMEDRGTGRVRL